MEGALILTVCVCVSLCRYFVSSGSYGGRYVVKESARYYTVHARRLKCCRFTEGDSTGLKRRVYCNNILSYKTKKSESFL